MPYLFFAILTGMVLDDSSTKVAYLCVIMPAGLPIYLTLVAWCYGLRCFTS